MLSKRFLLLASNASIRLASAGLRFIFVLICAKFLGLRDFGYLILFTAYIGFSVQVVGLEFYNVANREFVQGGVKLRGAILKTHLAVILVSYLVFIPLSLLFVSRSFPNNAFIFLFPILLITEHINQELFRLNTVIGKPLTASVINLGRNAAWTVPVGAILFFEPTHRNVEFTVSGWLAGSLVTAVLASAAFAKVRMSGWDRPIAWDWLRLSCAATITYFAAALSYRAIQTFDKSIIKYSGGIEFLASYGFYTSMAAIILIILDSTLLSFILPKILHFGQHANLRSIQTELCRATLPFTMISASAFFGLLFGTPYIIDLIGKSAFQDEAHIFPFILIATILQGAGVLANMPLYALRLDQKIFRANIAGLICFLLGASSAASLGLPEGVVYTLVVTFAISFFIKVFEFIRYCKSLPTA